MIMRLYTTGGLLAAALVPVSASFHGNLNYASPSRRHADLGIDVPHVQRRSLKRDAVSHKLEELSFTHGVASGDPWPESVVLWTRAAPTDDSDRSNATVEGTVALYNHDTESFVQADKSPICVEWAVFPYDDTWAANNTKAGFAGDAHKVAGGQAYTTSDIDYTIKIEAGGLKPFTTYNYQFKLCGSDITSPVGRTKTAPAKDDDVQGVKLAVFSCANYPVGYFNAYGNAARQDEHDYVVHLGDYIYEIGGTGERETVPAAASLYSLYDYRARHGQHRKDSDLQALSQGTSWISTWDDHEVSDNGYRDGSSVLVNTENSFLKAGAGVGVDQRKMNAVRAYFEWIPIRQVDLDDNLRIWRSFQLGNLMDLIMLDTRNYDRSITDLTVNTDYIGMIRDDASRSLMGPRQEAWFYNQLTRSHKRGASWRIIGNQIIFSNIVSSFGPNYDSWNGYVANRNRTLKHLYDSEISNNVFLAGDSHQNWVSDVVWEDEKEYNQATGKGAIGVEFAGTAVTSTGIKGDIETARQVASWCIGNNTALQWNDGYYRGYYLLSVTHDQVEAQYYGSPSVASKNAWSLPLANFTVEAGANKLSRPVAGGKVEAGALRGGETTPSNLTYNTDTKAWDVVGFEEMYLTTHKIK